MPSLLHLPWWGGVPVGLLVLQVALLGTTIYLHRYLTHKSLTLHPTMIAFFRITLWLFTGITPRFWAGVHRRHHQTTDLPDDPHSPVNLGWPHVLFFDGGDYRRGAKKNRDWIMKQPDLQPDRWDHLILDRGYPGLVAGILLAMFIFGWQAGLVIAGLELVCYLLAGGIINGLCHWFGQRPWTISGNERMVGQSTNLSGGWSALFLWVAGEVNHNNHHRFQKSPRLSMRLADARLLRAAAKITAVQGKPPAYNGEAFPHHWWDSVDPGWRVMQILRLLHLAEFEEKTKDYCKVLAEAQRIVDEAATLASESIFISA